MFPQPSLSMPSLSMDGMMGMRPTNPKGLSDDDSGSPWKNYSSLIFCFVLLVVFIVMYLLLQGSNSSIKTLQTDTDTTKSSVAAASGKLNTLENTVHTNQNSLASVSSDLNLLKPRVAFVETRFNEANDSLEEVKKSIQTISNTVSSTKDELQSKQTSDMSTITKSISDLTTVTSGLTTSLTTNYLTRVDMENDYATLEYLTTRYYDKSYLDNKLYLKSEIDTLFYRRELVDAMFVKDDDLNLHYYTKTDVDNSFVKISDLLARENTMTSIFSTKDELKTGYYPRAEADTKFVSQQHLESTLVTNYYTQRQTHDLFISNDELTNALKSYYTADKSDSTFITFPSLKTSLSNYYTISDMKNNYYDINYINQNFASRTNLTATITAIMALTQPVIKEQFGVLLDVQNNPLIYNVKSVNGNFGIGYNVRNNEPILRVSNAYDTFLKGRLYMNHPDDTTTMWCAKGVGKEFSFSYVDDTQTVKDALKFIYDAPSAAPTTFLPYGTLKLANVTIKTPTPKSLSFQDLLLIDTEANRVQVGMDSRSIVSIQGDMNLSGESFFSGETTFSNHVLLKNDINVQGKSTFNGLLECKGLVQCLGETQFNTTLFGGKSTFGDLASFQKDMNIAGTGRFASVIVDGQTTMNMMNVTGDSTFASITANGLVTCNNKLNVRGDSTFGKATISNLVVNGEMTLSSGARMKSIAMDGSIMFPNAISIYNTNNQLNLTDALYVDTVSRHTNALGRFVSPLGFELNGDGDPNGHWIMSTIGNYSVGFSRKDGSNYVLKSWMDENGSFVSPTGSIRVGNMSGAGAGVVRLGQWTSLYGDQSLFKLRSGGDSPVDMMSFDLPTSVSTFYGNVNAPHMTLTGGVMNGSIEFTGDVDDADWMIGLTGDYRLGFSRREDGVNYVQKAYLDPNGSFITKGNVDCVALAVDDKVYLGDKFRLNSNGNTFSMIADGVSCLTMDAVNKTTKINNSLLVDVVRFVGDPDPQTHWSMGNIGNNRFGFLRKADGTNYSIQSFIQPNGTYYSGSGNVDVNRVQAHGAFVSGGFELSGDAPDAHWLMALNGGYKLSFLRKDDGTNYREKAWIDANGSYKTLADMQCSTMSATTRVMTPRVVVGQYMQVNANDDSLWLSAGDANPIIKTDLWTGNVTIGRTNALSQNNGTTNTQRISMRIRENGLVSIADDNGNAFLQLGNNDQNAQSRIRFGLNASIAGNANGLSVMKNDSSSILSFNFQNSLATFDSNTIINGGLTASNVKANETISATRFISTGLQGLGGIEFTGDIVPAQWKICLAGGEKLGFMKRSNFAPNDYIPVVGIDEGGYTGLSDERYKSDIEEINIDRSLEKILNTNVYSYTYNFSNSKKKSIGVLAQEMKDINQYCIDKTDTTFLVRYNDLFLHNINATKVIYAELQLLKTSVDSIQVNLDVVVIEQVKQENKEIKSVLETQQKTLSIQEQKWKETNNIVEEQTLEIQSLRQTVDQQALTIQSMQEQMDKLTALVTQLLASK